MTEIKAEPSLRGKEKRDHPKRGGKKVCNLSRRGDVRGRKIPIMCWEELGGKGRLQGEGNIHDHDKRVSRTSARDENETR